jgi:hypothetical protein
MTPAQKAVLDVLAGRGAHARAGVPYEGRWLACRPGANGIIKRVSGAMVAALLAHGWARTDRWSQVLITKAGRAALRGGR